MGILWRFVLWLAIVHALLLVLFFFFGLLIRLQENRFLTVEKERVGQALEQLLEIEGRAGKSGGGASWFEWREGAELTSVRSTNGEEITQPLGRAQLDRWEILLGAQLTLSRAQPEPVRSAWNRGDAPWAYPLNGVLGAPVAWVHAYPEPERLQSLGEVASALHRLMLAALVADGLAVLGLVYGMFIHPVVRIRRALDAQDDSWVQSLKAKPGEHGKIARMIGMFFRQQSELRRRDAQLTEAIRERERISRDLHDDLIQQLYALGLKLEAHQGQAARPATESPSGSQFRPIINRLIAQVRGYIESPPLSAVSVPWSDELKPLCGKLSDQFACSIDFQYHGPELYPNEVTRREVAAILGEAVSNAVRHGGAEKVEVRVEVSAEHTDFLIADQGPGFDPEKIQRGMGLNNIENRAAGIGAEVGIDSRIGEGTRIRLSWRHA